MAEVEPPDPPEDVPPVVPALQVGAALSRTFRVWGTNFVPFTAVAGLLYVPLYVWLWMPRGDGYGRAARALVAATAPLLGGLLLLLATGFLAPGAVEALRGERPRILSLLVAGVRHLPRLLVVSILLALAVFAWMIPGSVLLAVVRPRSELDETVWVVQSILGLLALAIPPTLSLARLAVSVPVAALERKVGFAAFARSRSLTQGSRWRVFGVFLVLLLLLWGAMLFVNLLLHDLRLRMWALAAVWTLLTPGVLGVAVGVVYEDLRLASDGRSHEGLARAFE